MSAPTNGGPAARVPSTSTAAPETASPGGEFAGATPGPWLLNQISRGNVEVIKSENCRRSCIAILWAAQLDEEHGGCIKANARLIVAAPELLAQRDAARAELAAVRADVDSHEKQMDYLQAELDAESDRLIVARNEARSLAASLDAALAELRQRTSERDQARAILQRLADNKSGEPIVYANLRHEARAALGAERPA